MKTQYNSDERQSIGVRTIPRMPGIEELEKDFEEYQKELRLGKVKRERRKEEKPEVDKEGNEGRQIPELKDYIYVPSIKLYVAKERSFNGKDWYKCHEALKQEDARMLTIPEFVEFLKYSKVKAPEVYEDITAVREPYRAEWLDGFFEKRKDGLYVLTQNKSQSEKLDDCLMEDCQADILGSANKQGLPTRKLNGFYYWYPRENSVARFIAYSGRAYLDCYVYPTYGYSSLGVRVARCAAPSVCPKNGGFK